MRIRSLIVAATACIGLAACDGLREALTAHVDVAASAGSQELSVQRLADLLGKSKLAIPVTKQNAQTIATLWADYQLMGVAAARGDSLTDRKAIDEAAAGFLAGMRLQRFTDSIGKTFPVDSASEAGYNAGKAGLYAARHILFGTNPTMTPPQRDSVRRAAEAVRPTVTDANFGDMAAKHSTEPGASERRGNLGVFPRGQMVKEFGDAIATLKPGEIAPTLVETQFGYHIVQRLPYAAARQEYQASYGQFARAASESTYLVGLEQKAKTKVRDDAPAKIKAALKDPQAHRKDDDALASYEGGTLTVGRFITWVNSAPNAQQIAQQLQTVPDSAIKGITERVVRNELMLKEADRLKIDVPEQEKQQIYARFAQMVREVWTALGIAPETLRDSAKTAADRERLVAQRIDAFVDRLVNGQAQPVSVPPILSSILADKYELKLNQQGIDRAVEQAQSVRRIADSTRAASQPRSSVPLPGAPGAPGAGGQAPPGAPPAGGQQQPPNHP